MMVNCLLVDNALLIGSGGLHPGARAIRTGIRLNSKSAGRPRGAEAPASPNPLAFWRESFAG